MSKYRIYENNNNNEIMTTTVLKFTKNIMGIY
jgi:hypothetical protein